MAIPYDVHATLEDSMGLLSIALGEWEDRDDSKPQPLMRQAANVAMDEIDYMLRHLFSMRSRLAAEIRASDDAAMARAGALLEGSRS